MRQRGRARNARAAVAGGGDRPEMGIPCGYSIPFKVYLVYPLGACDVGCRAAAVRSTGAEERMFISSAGGPHTSLGYPSSLRGTV